ncbi:protein kinase [Streptomyces sp. NPDC005195]|uniref:serine/threonine-protein kinase n=1 Tax=Streptomyces sp. NPDC005195 TaxID=3154561 RepID=UPI0033B8AD5B
MGEVFAGRYELVDPIGHGGVGAVWRAWDRRRRRYVAAKVLQQSDAHALLRFVREQALRIDHPHVLAPASWAADDDKVLFTMDLVAGGSLVHLVNDYGPLPPAFVCTLLDQLLAGLAAVHTEGVLHRDIKPANILLEATGTARPRLRLSDFGIAMRLGEARLTETNYVVGTPGYFAPEQMMGAEPDFPADLFAVGLVALYLLEGAKPDAKALIEYFAENGTPPAPQGIPEPLWQVVATLLQPDPQARFRTATGARKALASAAELLPEPGPDDELVEVFDQVGPLPPGFGPTGPAGTAPRTATEHTASQPGPLPGHAPDQKPDSGQVPLPDRSLPSGRSPAHGQGAVPDTGDVRPESPPGDVAPHHAPDPASPRPSTMSDTGSFHLPPPRATGPQAPPQPPSGPPPQPQHQPPAHDFPGQKPQPQPQHAWHETQRHPVPGHPWRPPEQPPTPPTAVNVPSTAPVFARPFDLPSAPAPVPPRPADPTVVVQQHAPGSAGSHRAVSRRAARPGPPGRVAVPLLFLALACFAVGFWALTRL